MATHNSEIGNLSLEFVRVTELSAIAAAKWIGKGEKELADKAAVDAMREILNQIDFSGEIVIGEGAKDRSYELFIGEKVGTGKGPTLDIAVDPLECTSSVAFGRPNALTVIATGPKNTLYKAIDSYMQKIAVGPKAKKIIDLDAPTKDNISKVAAALGKDISEITVAILDREKHQDLVKEVRACGARTQLFTDGDIAMAIASCLDESPVDMLMGIGGSTEAVLTAVALKCLDGEILCRWKPKNEEGVKILNNAGITDFDKIFSRDDLAKGDDLAFTASGVITGPILEGVVFGQNHITTHTVVMSSNPKMIRFIETKHI
ncbi:MAG: class II fructose-bisphosphatase [Candidatus Curtissbacteria bacterium]|nr:class II fructose-bisphosphatase [Candidatus Curtissbacteria bacterium]